MNHRILKFGSALAVWLFFTNVVTAKEWRGILPLKSTRADVERLLGKPNEFGRYQFEDERAYIDYSTGCDKLKNCLCLIPKDVVIRIAVTIERDLKFSDLRIDVTKYRKQRSSHLPGVVIYANDAEGIIFTVDQDDQEVTHITYVPTTADCRKVIKSHPAARRRFSIARESSLSRRAKRSIPEGMHL
jgi:hypothetical protein